MNNIKLTANHFKIRKQKELESSIVEVLSIIERQINICFERGEFERIERTFGFLSDELKPKIIENFEPRGFKVDFINKEYSPAFETTVVLTVE